MTFSKCSIPSISLSSPDRSRSRPVLSLTLRSVSMSTGETYFFSVTHSASNPSKPRICHHRSPPTTRDSSTGSNHSMSLPAASLQECKGMSTGATTDQGGDGTWVFVLNTCSILQTKGMHITRYSLRLQRLHAVVCTNFKKLLDDVIRSKHLRMCFFQEMRSRTYSSNRTSSFTFSGWSLERSFEALPCRFRHNVLRTTSEGVKTVWGKTDKTATYLVRCALLSRLC